MKPQGTHGDNDNPRLDGHDGSAPFRVPDGYFDSLQDRIMDNMAAEEVTGTKPEKGKRVQMSRYVIPAIAASLLAIGVWIWQATDNQAGPGSDELLADLTEQEMIDYLAQSGIEVEDIAFEAPQTVPEEVDILPEAGDIPDDIWEEEIMYGDLYDLI